MKGDFSRLTFDPHRHFSRVLMQQGRVLLDADWNEQVYGLLHYLRSAIADLEGPILPIGEGFKITLRKDPKGNPMDDDFRIEPGHLYVDGILCENAEAAFYSTQPDYPLDNRDPIEEPHLVYVDVWERHITHVQDARIREVALGGTDTTTRARVIWQVKLHKLPQGDTCKEVVANWSSLIAEWQAKNRGALQARTKRPAGFATDNPCITSPEARYRGLANRLYRVEIHTGGTVGEATFKWSRENGSVVFPVRSLSGVIAHVETLGADEPHSLAPGAWVEITDDHGELKGEPGQLAEVDFIDPVERSVTLRAPDDVELPEFDEDSKTHPILRRWDYRHGVEGAGSEADDGAVVVEEGLWLTLEDGIEIRFAPEAGAAHGYRTGDYWLVPARTETGDIEWPNDADDSPETLGPYGVVHHYAPLAMISSLGSGTEPEDCVESIRRRHG